jgi:D-alanyl-D-alanine carboxypeptidase (penicillin-binding protein 5/6)
VPLVGNGSIDLFLPKAAQNCPQAEVTYKAPIRPPVTKGQPLATLVVKCNDKIVQQTPLYAGADVEDGDIVRKATDALKELALGWL